MFIQLPIFLALAPFVGFTAIWGCVTPLLIRWRYRYLPDRHPRPTSAPVSPEASPEAFMSLIQSYSEPIQVTTSSSFQTSPGGHPLIPLRPQDDSSQDHVMLAVPPLERTLTDSRDPNPFVLLRYPDEIATTSVPSPPGRRWSCPRRAPSVQTQTIVTSSAVLNTQALPRLAEAACSAAPSQLFQGPWSPEDGTRTLVMPTVPALCSRDSYVFLPELGSQTRLNAQGHQQRFASRTSIPYDSVMAIRPLPLAPLAGPCAPATYQQPLLDDQGQPLAYVNTRAVWGFHRTPLSSPQVGYVDRLCTAQLRYPPGHQLRDVVITMDLEGDRNRPVGIFENSETGRVEGFFFTPISRPVGSNPENPEDHPTYREIPD